MSQKPYVIDNMISAKSIAARIEQLAAEIEQEFADTDKLVVVGLLRGSFVFIADLVREMVDVCGNDYKSHNEINPTHKGDQKRSHTSYDYNPSDDD